MKGTAAASLVGHGPDFLCSLLRAIAPVRAARVGTSFFSPELPIAEARGSVMCRRALPNVNLYSFCFFFSLCSPLNYKCRETTGTSSDLLVPSSHGLNDCSSPVLGTGETTIEPDI